jgi:hypothetical protein
MNDDLTSFRCELVVKLNTSYKRNGPFHAPGCPVATKVHMLYLCIIRDSSCSLSGSTILIYIYIYHLCALNVVASGINDIIVQ